MKTLTVGLLSVGLLAAQTSQNPVQNQSGNPTSSGQPQTGSSGQGQMTNSGSGTMSDSDRMRTDKMSRGTQQNYTGMLLDASCAAVSGTGGMSGGMAGMAHGGAHSAMTPAGGTGASAPGENMGRRETAASSTRMTEQGTGSGTGGTSTTTSNTTTTNSTMTSDSRSATTTTGATGATGTRTTGADMARTTGADMPMDRSTSNQSNMQGGMRSGAAMASDRMAGGQGMMQHGNLPAACYPTMSTTQFAVMANGQVMRLDDRSNQQLAKRIQGNDKFREALGGTPPVNVNVDVTGTMEGDRLKVKSIRRSGQ